MKLSPETVILKCKVNQNLRESLFNNIELDNEIFFLIFSDEQKLVYLLNPASVRHVKFCRNTPD
jgi:hypothetical protein